MVVKKKKKKKIIIMGSYQLHERRKKYRSKMFATCRVGGLNETEEYARFFPFRFCVSLFLEVSTSPHFFVLI